MNRKRFLQQLFWLLAICFTVALVSDRSQAGEETVPFAKPMVTETTWPGVSVELTSIEPASGDMLLMKFKYVNSGSAHAKLKKPTNSILRETYYVDVKNKRKYSPIQDERHHVVGEAPRLPHNELDPGQSATFWAKFPAPPPDVRKIDLYFPGAFPLENVPIR